MSNKIDIWCAGKEWCPITATANIIAKKWHPVIIDRLLKEEKLGFNALKEEVDGISSKVLSESLEDLQEKNIVEREVVNEKPYRVEYRLTEVGKELKPVIRKMGEWGNKNLREVSKEDSVL